MVVCGRLESCDILSNVLLLTKFCQVLFYLGHGLVVMGGDSCSEGREFEFFPFFVCKNCNVWKDEQEAGMGHFKKNIFLKHWTFVKTTPPVITQWHLLYLGSRCYRRKRHSTKEKRYWRPTIKRHIKEFVWMSCRCVWGLKVRYGVSGCRHSTVDSVALFHPATPGSSPKQTIYAFMI